jgi:hypothetical protein
LGRSESFSLCSIIFGFYFRYGSTGFFFLPKKKEKSLEALRVLGPDIGRKTGGQNHFLRESGSGFDPTFLGGNDGGGFLHSRVGQLGTFLDEKITAHGDEDKSRLRRDVRRKSKMRFYPKLEEI